MAKKNYLRAKITRFSLGIGIIPKICPICKNSLPGGILEEHHWGTKRGQEGQFEAFRLGKTRRMCKSCNQILGPCMGQVDIVGRGRSVRFWVKRFQEHISRLYDTTYTWEEQFGLLSEYFRSSYKEGKYPNFDGIEGGWSRFLPIEEDIYRKIIREE